MKRIAFALLAFAAGAWAFADDATAPATPAPQGQFHSWNIGEFVPAESYNNGPVAAGWGPNWDAAGGLDQEWGFTYDNPTKTFGFDATTEFGGANFGNSGSNYTTNYSGTLNLPSSNLSWFGTYFVLVGGYAKIYAGMPRDNDYTFLSYINGNPVDQRLMDSQWGANLQIFPVSGLALMLTDYIPGSQNAGPGAPGVDFPDNFAVGAKYSVPNTATVYAYYKAIQSTYDNSQAIAATLPNGTTLAQAIANGNLGNLTGTLNKKYFDIGAQYNGIKGVGFQAEFAYDMSTIANVPTFATLNTFSPGTGSAFNQVELELGATTTLVQDWALTADLFLYSNSTATVATIEADAQYNIPTTPYSVGAFLGYDGGAGQFNGGGDAAPALNGGSGAGLLIYPYVQQTFDNGNADVRVGFEYLGGGVSNAVVAGQVAKLANSTNAAWGIPISYVWTF